MTSWIQNIIDLKNPPAKKERSWLENSKNLGAALRKVCIKLSLQILDEKFDISMINEEKPIHIDQLEDKEKTCFIRQIYLIGDDIPLTYGRVVVPKNVYLQYLDAFTSLGNKLIGETLLYNNARTTRTPFEFATLTKKDMLYTLAIAQLSHHFAQLDTLWARRSVFYIDGIHPLLISEVVFPNIPPYRDQEM